MTRRLARATLTAGALLIGGCAVGPDYHRPAVPAASGYAVSTLPDTTAASEGPGGQAQRFVVGGVVDRDWWTRFRSPALNRLVEQSLAASPTLEAARAALLAAQETVEAQRGFFYPGAQATYSVTRVRTADALASPAASGAAYFTLHTAQLTVGFVPDVFGLNRRQVESLEAQAEIGRLQLEAARVTLAANVVAAVIQEAMLREQIAIGQRIVDSGEQASALAQRQRQGGWATQLDVALQETALAQSRQLLPSLQKQLAQTRDLLRLLVGTTPDAEGLPAIDLDALTLPDDLPLSLPSQLLEQRPDVRAAEEQLHAASAQIGVAQANRLPQFAIDAAVGGAATTLASALASPGKFFSVTGGVAQSVFDGGTLRHRQQVAEALYDEAAAQYRGTVLAAYQNVADCLHALYADADNLRAASAAERSSAQTLSLVDRQLTRGIVDRLTLLSARQAHDQALLTVASARAVRLGETVSLLQALGGGWLRADSAVSPVDASSKDPPAAPR